MRNGLEQTLENFRAIDAAATLAHPSARGYVTMPGHNSVARPAPATTEPARVDWHVAAQLASRGIYEIPSADLAAARDLQIRCAKVRDEIDTKFTREAALRDFAAEQKTTWEKFYSNPNADLSKAPAQNAEGKVAEYAQRLTVARRIFNQLCEDSRELCAPLIRNFIERATIELQRLEHDEFSEAQKFGMTYTPGPRVQTLRKVIENLRAREKDKSTGTPAQLLIWQKL
jgi:hypothetical protein